MSEESIKTPAISDDNLDSKPTFIHNIKIAVEFKGRCLKLDKATLTHRDVVNFFYCLWIKEDT